MNLTILYSAVVIGLIASYLAVFLCHRRVAYFASSLAADVVPTYNTIRVYRMTYLILGIVLAAIFATVYNYLSDYEYKNWISVIVVLFVPMVIYMIIPKSTYLLFESVNCKAWFEVYLCMKNSMIYGFLIVFFIILALGSVVNAVI